LGYDNFHKNLRKEIFPGKAPSIDDYRSFYITQFYNNRSMDEKDQKEEHSHADKEVLAKQMLHSAQEAYKT
jgi:hypothetical protein